MSKCPLTLLFSMLIGLMLGFGAPSAAFADQSNPTLGRLFDRLATSSEPLEAETIEKVIWGLWSEPKTDTVRFCVYPCRRRHGRRRPRQRAETL